MVRWHGAAHGVAHRGGRWRAGLARSEQSKRINLRVGHESKPRMVVLTNDDGIEAVGFEMLVKALHRAGYHSLCWRRRESFGDRHAHQSDETHGVPRPRGFGLRLGTRPACHARASFELDGTPCDTMIVALDGGLNHLVPGVHPQLVVSGVNLGPNLSQDSYHSGTMGAAREAGLYGVPAVAASFTSFDPEGMERAVDATLEVVAKATAVLPAKARTSAGQTALWTQGTSLPGRKQQQTTAGWPTPRQRSCLRSPTET